MKKGHNYSKINNQICVQLSYYYRPIYKTVETRMKTIIATYICKIRINYI